MFNLAIMIVLTLLLVQVDKSPTQGCPERGGNWGNLPSAPGFRGPPEDYKRV